MTQNIPLQQELSNVSIHVLNVKDKRDNKRKFTLRDLSNQDFAGQGDEITSKEQERRQRKRFDANNSMNKVIGDVKFGEDEDLQGELDTKKRIRKKRLNEDGEYEYYYDYEYDEEEIRNLSPEELTNSLFANNPELRAKYLQAYKQLSALEKKQLDDWIKAMNEFLMSDEDYHNLSFLDDMEKFAESLIESLKTQQSKFDFAIVGPRYSGKTTFLAVLLSKMTDLFAATGKWKRLFILYVDFKLISEQTQNLADLYQRIVEITFVQLGKQYSLFRPYMQKTLAFFKDLPSGRVAPSFPHRIAIEREFPMAQLKLTQLAQTMFNLFRQVTPLESAINQILAFPEKIGQIFNKPEIQYIIDHFERSKILIDRTDTLTSESKKVSVVSLLKQFILGKSFVIASENEPEFLEILQSIKRSSPKLTTKVIISNMSDIPIGVDKKDESKRELHVSYKDGHSHVVFTREKCQGCVGFLVRWNELMRLATAVEENRALQSNMANLRSEREGAKSQADIRLLDFVVRFLPQVYTKTGELPDSEIQSAYVISRKGA